MTSRGLFITFEGGEGAGKSSLIRKLERTLSARGHPIVTTREPGGSKLGEHIREWLLNPQFKAEVGQMAELLLFLAGRAQHLQELILPALKQGKIVLCDRFNDSTIAYQGVARGLGMEETEALCDLVCRGITPDLTLFLDVDPIEGLKRASRRQKRIDPTQSGDRLESEDLSFHEHVRQGFHSLALEYPQRIHRLDSNQPEDVVYANALKTIETMLKTPHE